MPLTTPLMGLPNPIPETDSGPAYADDIEACFNIIDGHNHSVGSGNQINSDGILINSDFPINSYNLTLAKSVRFTAQGSPLAGSSDLGCLYESGVDLYYNDGNGNQVRITSGGSVNATSSGISSGTASAAFSGGVLIVDSNTNTPANIKVGSVLIGEVTVSPNFITLSSPTSLAANYTLTFPATLPAATSFATIDASGAIATGVAYSGGLTTSNLSASAGILKSQLAAVGQQISSSSGGYSTSSTTPADVTNLSVSITTSGRPVFLSIMPASGSAQACFQSATTTGGYISFTRGGTAIAQCKISGTGTGSVRVPPSLTFLDTPGAGTYTYKVQAASAVSDTISVTNCILVAYEL